MMNHGKDILKEYRSNKVRGKVIGFLLNVLSKLLIGSTVGVFLTAGFYSMNVILTI